ncbi:HNH endonuclease [Celeribacter ethanolicus]|uniref:HNH endonuclease n=1 Tax=Celeribacter ethanolicus TaxID=1758178 RepID=UPI000AEE4E90|nr:HNH endonuclease [Celeribacter ethanolicus]
MSEETLETLRNAAIKLWQEKETRPASLKEKIERATVFLVVKHEQDEFVVPLAWAWDAHKPNWQSETKSSNTTSVTNKVKKLGLQELPKNSVEHQHCWDLSLQALRELKSTKGFSKRDERTRSRVPSDNRYYILEAENIGASSFSPEELAKNAGADGAVSQITTNRYERKPANRRACIAHHLTDDNRILCEVCKIDFQERYGEIGRGYIHIHHVHPLGNKQSPKDFDPTVHLKPLCPNCHAMIHRLTDVENGIETLRSIIEKSNVGLQDA